MTDEFTRQRRNLFLSGFILVFIVFYWKHINTFNFLWILKLKDIPILDLFYWTLFFYIYFIIRYIHSLIDWKVFENIRKNSFYDFFSKKGGFKNVIHLINYQNLPSNSEILLIWKENDLLVLYHNENSKISQITSNNCVNLNKLFYLNKIKKKEYFEENITNTKLKEYLIEIVDEYHTWFYYSIKKWDIEYFYKKYFWMIRNIIFNKKISDYIWPLIFIFLTWIIIYAKLHNIPFIIITKV